MRFLANLCWESNDLNFSTGIRMIIHVPEGIIDPLASSLGPFLWYTSIHLLPTII
jgi:hypothetical protein